MPGGLDVTYIKLDIEDATLLQVQGNAIHMFYLSM